MERENRSIPTAEAYEKKLARHIKMFIGRNLHLRLNTKIVAAHFSISSTTLQRLCHKYVGCSFGKYIEDMRIRRAAKLLKKGKLIKEAMHETGYRHRSTFYRAFKKRYDHPPSFFRK